MKKDIHSSIYYPFPDPLHGSEDSPLAVGGNLKPALLLHAYSCGIFPWFSEDAIKLWWCPDPRCIMLLENFHLPKRSARKLKKLPFRLTFNAAFDQVLAECSRKRKQQDGTWITEGIRKAYHELHVMGYAHSVETWNGEELVGGLYGIALGKAFFGESMFHRENESSRAALAGLASLLRKENFIFIDCQQETPHMMNMGASCISRTDFLKLLEKAVPKYPFSGDDARPLWDTWKRRYIHRGNPVDGLWL